VSAPDEATVGADGFVEIDRGAAVWRFERAFLESNWTCLFGRGCHGILDRPAAELGEGCCSLGAHFGDGPAGADEAMEVAAHAAAIPAELFQQHRAALDGIFGDDDRTHTRVVDGACIFLNRPGFPGGAGCALHLAADALGEPVTEWKPSVCWQLPLRVDWEPVDDEHEIATVRRWTRADWGEHGRTMAWCCTERDDGGEAYCGDVAVIDAQRAELEAIADSDVIEAVRVALGRRRTG
jgi:hypothetical protein